MKQADFKDLTSLQLNIAKKEKHDDGSQFRFSEVAAFRFDEGMPLQLKIKYHYTDAEDFRYVNVTRKGLAHQEPNPFQLPRKYLKPIPINEKKTEGCYVINAIYSRCLKGILQRSV